MAVLSLAGALMFVAHVGVSTAQVSKPQQPFGLLIEKWNGALQRARQTIAQPELTRQQLLRVTESVEAVKREATAYGARSEALLESQSRQLRALGPVPADDEPPDADNIIALRDALERDVAFYRARVQQADLTVARADQTLRDLVVVRRQRLTRMVFHRGPSPLEPSVWREAIQQGHEAHTGRFSSRIYEGLVSARAAGYGLGHLLWMLSIPALLLLVGWPIRKWILDRYGRDPACEAPSYTRRVLAVFIEGLVRGVLYALIPALLYVSIPKEALNEDVANLVTAVMVGLVFLFVVGQLVKAAFAPDAPQWRIVPIKPEASRNLGRRLFGLTAVMSVLISLSMLSEATSAAHSEYESVERTIFATIISIVLLSLLQRRLWFPQAESAEEKSEGEVGAHWLWRVSPPLLAVIIVAVPFIAFAGYTRLADSIVIALTLTGLLFGGLLLTRELVGEFIEWLLTPTGRHQGVAQRLFTLSDRSGGVLAFWIRTGLNLTLTMLGVLGLLLIWGVPPGTLRLWFMSAMEGITVGELTIAPTQVLIAVFLFVALMTGTRLLQRWLGNTFLPRTQIHAHVQHSLTAAVGYVGVTLAAVLSIASLGLNVANLALIAGALSVGIGFGLQSIVNNFVSGLILLVERPVSVGDWVIVGGHEGFVRRVNIRSTEIQTFTRATVILPNSEILSTSVINYTHRDRYGRIEVPVRVDRDSDPEQVRELLMGCLHRHPLILAWPEPFVLFKDFGESSLQFEARGFLADVENSIMVKSEMRFQIERALREAGIEIPYPQRDLHIKEAGPLESLSFPARSDDEDQSRTESIVEFKGRGGIMQAGAESETSSDRKA